MKSHLQSDGKIFLAALIIFMVGCSTSSKSSRRDKTPADEAEVSVAQDAQTVEELRKNIPEDIRLRNDELKEVLSLMGEVKRHPQEIKDKFDRIQRNRRDKFTRENQRSRDAFTKTERKDKEQFLKKITSDRNDFNKNKKTTVEERHEFYNEQDAKRTDFFAGQRDKRGDFENEYSQKNKDFYAELNQQQKEFMEEWRNYKVKWENWQNSKNPKTSPAADDAAFDKMNVVPAESLETDH